MEEELVGNVLIAQSGGPTAVINASLAGIITEALNHGCIEEIYGGLNGIEGILNEQFIDLAEESQQVIRGLRHTPGAALGTCRYKMTNASDLERVMEVIRAHNIRYFFYIGGNDSQDTADKINAFAAETGWDMRVIGIPKTIDNDLPVTDHCPGYGSAIKSICTTVREISCDHESMGNHDLVSIVEVMGRNAGWLAAGATLAKSKGNMEGAPHLIYLPETPFSSTKFVEDVQAVLQREKYCVVVVSEGVVDNEGNYIAANTSATDAFGHSALGGAGETLKSILEDQLEVKARTIKLGYAQRAAATHASQTDNDEAFTCGKEAVKAAVTGDTGKMITLVRSDSDPYTCEYALADLSEVANAVKTFPEAWINEDHTSVSHQFVKYALPLVEGEISVPYEHGVPQFVKLAKLPVTKLLNARANVS